MMNIGRNTSANHSDDQPGKPRVILIAGGVFAIIAILVFAYIYTTRDTPPQGLLFVIPAGASETIDVPTIDSAIDIPTEIVFSAGDVSRITIRNDDAVAHRAGPWVVGAGQSYTMRFDKPGTFQFDCTVDVSESVTIVVEEP